MKKVKKGKGGAAYWGLKSKRSAKAEKKTGKGGFLLGTFRGKRTKE